MTSSPQPPCVLVVEDEESISSMLELVLQHMGYRVCLADSVDTALEALRSAQIDVAMLDVTLAGVESFPVAEALRRRGIPLMFSSGHAAADLPEAWRAERILRKPYDQRTLKNALDDLLDARDTEPCESA